MMPRMMKNTPRASKKMLIRLKSPRKTESPRTNPIAMITAPQKMLFMTCPRFEELQCSKFGHPLGQPRLIQPSVGVLHSRDILWSTYAIHQAVARHGAGNQNRSHSARQSGSVVHAPDLDCDRHHRVGVARRADFSA